MVRAKDLDSGLEKTIGQCCMHLLPSCTRGASESGTKGSVKQPSVCLLLLLVIRDCLFSQWVFSIFRVGEWML